MSERPFPKILEHHDDNSFSVECAFCEGRGIFPETIYSDYSVETDPCPVCNGIGVNLLAEPQEKWFGCKYCDISGKSWDENGHFVGDTCPVCKGKGVNNIGSNASQTDEHYFWDLIHPKIVEISKSRFDAGHYADAVESAMKEINSIVKEIVKSKIGQELDGANLMQRALSLDRPIIKLSELSTDSEKNIQKGYLQIFSGAMTGIRNPKAHENLIIDEKLAIHFIFVASLLMFKIDEDRED